MLQMELTAAAGKEDKKKEGSRCVTTHLESSMFFSFFSFTLLMPIYDRPQKKGQETVRVGQGLEMCFVLSPGMFFFFFILKFLSPGNIFFLSPFFIYSNNDFSFIF